MTFLIRFMFVVLTLLPVGTYLVYYYRRLDTRRKQLLQTLLSLSLQDEYVLMRHKEKYDEWRNCGSDEVLIEEFQNKYFNLDFRAGHSHQDYIWPLLLFTAFTAIGWTLTLQRVLPGFLPLSELRVIPDALAYGFVGAYLACILTIFDGFRRYDLDPGLYYSITYRVMFSSFAAWVASLMFANNFQPLIALGIGLFPLEKTWSFITERAASVLGTGQNEKEVGIELANIQGLEHSTNRQRLIDVGITTVQALATADPLLLFFLTTFPLRAVVDMIDKAILYLYLGDKVKELRTHGINGVIELVALAKLAEKIPAYQSQDNTPAADEPLGELFKDVNTEELVNNVANVIGQTPQELKAFIYNMYYDPMVKFIYEIWGRYLNRPVERDMRRDSRTLPEVKTTDGNGAKEPQASGLDKMLT
jgi:hypothetical protein